MSGKFITEPIVGAHLMGTASKWLAQSLIKMMGFNTEFGYNLSL